VRGWLSDARFTEMLVHARKTKFGSTRVASELREKGVADDLIASAVAEVKITELDNAREVCRKKYKASPISREDWAKQARFLQSRGFGFDVIKKVLNEKINDN
jgi:regulatory protein